MAAASHNKMLSAALTFTLSFCRLYMTKKTSNLPLNAKNTPTFVLKAGVFLRYADMLSDFIEK